MSHARIVKALSAATLAILVPPAHAAPPTVVKVWNNVNLTTESCSAAFAVATTDPVFTLTFYTTTLQNFGSYDVMLQASPDGNSWTFTTVAKVNVPMQVTGSFSTTATFKALKYRVCLGHASDNALHNVYGSSAWVAN